MLGQGTLKATSADPPAEARRGRGLRRLSHRAAGDAASLLKVPTRDPRGERRHGRANRLLARARYRDRDGICRHQGHPGERAGQDRPYRQPDPPRGAGGREAALCQPGSRREAPSPRRRRQPGRPGHERRRAARRSSSAAGAARPPFVTQQARGEDLERVRAHYRAWVWNSRPSPSSRICRSAHGECPSRVSRSGASTVAELAVIGRPSILVPLPGSLDQDQAANAKTLGDLGAAIVCPQSDFTPERLATRFRLFSRARPLDASRGRRT